MPEVFPAVARPVRAAVTDRLRTGRNEPPVSVGSGNGGGKKGCSATDAMTAMAAFAALCASPTALADFADAVRETRPSAEIRYRLEAVDQQGMEKNARASTAKARLSWIVPAAQGFSAGLEGDYVFVVPPGSAERFNSTENGRTEYPVVADPTGFDLNQAFLRFRHDDLTVTAGRQRIVHFEQRFVGAVGWRQNEQTYDALRVQSSLGRVELDYSYVTGVNRIFGPGDGAQPGDWKGDSHLFRGTLTVSDGHSLGAFAYLLDFENDNGPPNSTATYGVDYRGAFGPLSVTGSVARQTDWARSPLSYNATYYALEARLRRGPMTFAAGYEVLGSDGGRAAFRTPLGTLHKFQGWADKFTGHAPGRYRGCLREGRRQARFGRPHARRARLQGGAWRRGLRARNRHPAQFSRVEKPCRVAQVRPLRCRGPRYRHRQVLADALLPVLNPVTRGHGATPGRRGRRGAHIRPLPFR